MKQVINIKIERKLDKYEEAIVKLMKEEEIEDTHNQIIKETIEYFVKEDCPLEAIKEFSVRIIE